MNLPILERLKDGEKFDFSILADSTEHTEEFWGWWWAEKAKPNEICRPEIISDDDPILSETIYKPTANLCSYREFFDKPFYPLTEAGVFPIKDGLSREAFQKLALRVVANSSTKLATRPQIVFAGGGYGSGKTTVINRLCDCGALPVGKKDLVGADVFKQLIPEYHLIKGVSDGRASLTVQKECVMLSNELFVRLIGNERSFVWDSSMSNKVDTLDRINLARKANYELTMIAVLTPLNIAIAQAMRRARLSGRFPHPAKLPESHVGFRSSFNDYVPYFDEIIVFANVGGDADTEVVAEKTSGAKELALLNADLFNSLLVPPAQ